MRSRRLRRRERESEARRALSQRSPGITGPKVPPADVARLSFDAVESGATEVLADDRARFVKSGITLDPAERHARIFAALGG